MEQLGARLNGKLVAWFAYPENDLQDNLAPEMRGYRAPFARAGRAGWDIVDDHLEPGKWRCSNMDVRRLFPRMCVPGPLAERAYSAVDYLIERANASCARAGARLVVVTIPHPMQLTKRGISTLAALSGAPALCDENLPDRTIAESCRRHAVPMVAAKDHLSRVHYKRREGIHWNDRGHRRMAEVLQDLHTSFKSGALDQYIPRRPEQRPEPTVARHPARLGAPTGSPATEGLGVAGR
jgi:hypothetical protein